MQTTAIGTVANSLPQNEVIFLTILILNRYVPYTDLRKIFVCGVLIFVQLVVKEAHGSLFLRFHGQYGEVQFCCDFFV